MEVHRPGATRSWREFISEIGIIVLGVLIALSAEQTVDYFRWSHKLGAAEESMRAELKSDLTFASEYAIFAKCTDHYLDRLESDLLKRDTGDLNRLYELGPPFTSRPWTATAWDATLNAQLADHMPLDRFLAYAETFRRANLMRDAQYQLRDRYVEAMTGRFGLSADAKVLADELAATEQMKVVVNFARVLAGRIEHDAEALNIDADDSALTRDRKHAADCEAELGNAR
jgi:hypothetical protein